MPTPSDVEREQPCWCLDGARLYGEAAIAALALSTVGGSSVVRVRLGNLSRSTSCCVQSVRVCIRKVVWCWSVVVRLRSARYLGSPRSCLTMPSSDARGDRLEVIASEDFRLLQEAELRELHTKESVKATR